jgi:prepilin-type N-terminal cleavage/methylation domain-containing protein
MKTKSRGFTLVEMAIVLVIIGLLMGGILKGQELINSAKVKTDANDFKVVTAAYYGYLDRFHAVAGDDSIASTHLPNPAATNATPANTTGNGSINGAWDSTTQSDESYLFWQHVRLAGLLSGNPVAGGVNYLPTNSDGGRIGISGTNPMANDAVQARGTFYVCSANITGRIATQLDTMLDDGVTNAGSVRAFIAGNNTSTSPLADGQLVTVCVAY